MTDEQKSDKNVATLAMASSGHMIYISMYLC